MKTLTMTTDFGLRDSYVAEMKGVLYACCADCVCIDITHTVSPGGLAEAAFVLKNAYHYFEDGAVHLVVVDPGVGTDRGILAVETTHFVFVGPDNGVLYEAATDDTVRGIHLLDIAAFTKSLARLFSGSNVIGRLLERGASRTFHGRDIFTPLAAYLLEGHPLGDVATLSRSMVRLDLPRPKIGENEVTGEIVHVDGFGNLITNIPSAAVRPGGEVFVRAGGEVRSVGPPKAAYADVEGGDLLALTGSRGYLEIGVNGGSAREMLGAACGDGVFIIASVG